MKITKVEVVKLFGVFNHSIPLNSNGNITIIIGENGLGKTIILEAINSFFSKKFSFFYNLEFERFLIHFDTREIWNITKIEQGLSISRESTSNKYSKSKGKLVEIIDKTSSGVYEIREREVIERRLERLERLEFEYFLLNQMRHSGVNTFLPKKIMSDRDRTDNLFIEYEASRRTKGDPLPNWLNQGIDKVKVRLIETQRLITSKDIDSQILQNSVERCSTDLKNIISKAIKEASDVTSRLDSTYPNRLINELKSQETDSFEQLNESLARLDERRKLLSSVGLVVDSNDANLLQINEHQKNLITVLGLYVNDSHSKLAPFEKLSEKIKLFKEIINKRFKHKKIEIQQDVGFIFRSTILKNTEDLFKTIPSSGLSSGEQNEIILFYKLIFDSLDGDMILIDEPELSLHISWQNKFIEDVKNITSINGFSIIIATHSPDIINDNWDLKVELEGVE